MEAIAQTTDILTRIVFYGQFLYGENAHHLVKPSHYAFSGHSEQS